MATDGMRDPEPVTLAVKNDRLLIPPISSRIPGSADDAPRAAPVIQVHPQNPLNRTDKQATLAEAVRMLKPWRPPPDRRLGAAEDALGAARLLHHPALRWPRNDPGSRDRGFPRSGFRRRLEPGLRARTLANARGRPLSLLGAQDKRCSNLERKRMLLASSGMKGRGSTALFADKGIMDKRGLGLADGLRLLVPARPGGCRRGFSPPSLPLVIARA